MIATHFIEVVKQIDGSITNVGPAPIRLLEWSLKMNERGLSSKTVAVFKIYPKPNPAPVHYDYYLETTIVE